MHLSAAIPVGDNPGEIRGHGAGFVNFGSIILSPERWPSGLDCFCTFVAVILKSVWYAQHFD